MLHTVASVALITLCAAFIAIYLPDAATAIGVLPYLLLSIAVVLVGFAVHTAHVRSIERSLLSPLQRIADITQAIGEGAVSGRVEVGESAASEVRVVATAINALARKAAGDIADMRRLERVRSEFIGNVSHELRTPIFSVQGYLETLMDGAIDDPEVSAQFLDKAYQNALRLNTLLTDLIEISRIESGELQFSFRSFSISDLLRELVRTMEIRATKRNVALVLDIPDGKDVRVYADKDRLTQVMTNLIDNAIKYNREGGTVTVSVEGNKGTATVAVQDTGIGIPEEHLARIFERFYRVDRDRSRAVGGTGLGLAIVKHILEAHHAPISIKSEPNVGTTISFTLKTG
jgi:two-component system, OmpR family, phosphate regulon sensor histidine kinase PhoR